MRLSEFKIYLDTLEIPIAYQVFGEETEVSPPFLVYYEDETYTFSADDKPYVEIIDLAVEIYTDYKDEVLEEKFEKLLNDLDLNYRTAENYIPSERMYEKLYYIGGIING